jgi:UDP-N-acetylglucosamine 2-epimerase
MEIQVHTGQYYDHGMSDFFFEELKIPKPDYHLGVGPGSHGEQMGKMLAEIEKSELSRSWTPGSSSATRT